MTRKEFVAAVPAAALAAQKPLVAPEGATPGRPKNVLFLLSDQHRPSSIGHLRDPLARTPTIDNLAATGTRFSNAYCTNPVCTPSRASILTGRYTHHHRTWNNATPWPFEIKTMAHHFSRAGYVSGLIGKMHFVDAQTHGFDYRLDFNDWFQYLGPQTKLYADELARANSGSGLPIVDDLWRDFGDPWQGHRTADERQGYVHTGRASKIPERDHFESFVSRESIRFIKRFSPQHPFFLISSYLKPHDPFMPPERHAQMFRAADMHLPDTYGKVDLKRVPAEIRARIEAPTATPELKDPAAARQRIAMYYANVAFLDECMGQVTKALDELGLANNTVVIYSSDHGEMLGEHGMWQKFVFYEPSVGVPLIVRLPGVTPPGSVCRTPVSQASIMATLLDLCGIPVPEGLDGEPLTPYLQDPQRVTKQTAPVFSQYAADTPELYNLRDDPQEMNNLAESRLHKPRVEELKSELLTWSNPAAV